jgi:RimJ/RimL family protein N-acetyltransferase
MNSYKALSTQEFGSKDSFRIIPIRSEDKFDIMKWRNEQIYHLRQTELLTRETQDRYFGEVIHPLFNKENPEQILFSYLHKETCIGYGGLVHIDWESKNSEISFLIDTALEKDYFDFHWTTFIELIKEVAFNNLQLHKIYVYSFDLRPLLYKVLENTGFLREAVLKEHHLHDNKFIDVKIYSRINHQ